MSFVQHESSFQKRVSVLEQQNKILGESLIQINSCYEEKIMILQSRLAQYEDRCQQLLEEKRQATQGKIRQISLYQQEIEKMMNIVETVQGNYERENLQLKETLKQKQLKIQQLQKERIQDRQRVQRLAHKYLSEITKLQFQLKELKEGDIGIIEEQQNEDSQKGQQKEEKDQSEITVLKDIGNIQKIRLSGKKQQLIQIQ